MKGYYKFSFYLIQFTICGLALFSTFWSVPLVNFTCLRRKISAIKFFRSLEF